MIPNPNHRWRDDSARFPSYAPSSLCSDRAFVRWVARVICIRISPYFNSSLRNRWVPFSQLFRNRRVCLIQSLRSFIRGHAICLLHQHGPWQFLSERVLLFCWFRYASFQPVWFMLISISFAVALPCQRYIRCRFRISPLVFAFALGFKHMWWFSLLYQWFRSGGSLGFIHCVGLRHQRSFRPVSAFPPGYVPRAIHTFGTSVAPRFWDFRCSALLGLPLLRTSFGSVLFSHSDPIGRRFDQSSQFSTPTQSPILVLGGFPWMFGPSAY